MSWANLAVVPSWPSASATPSLGLEDVRVAVLKMNAGHMNRADDRALAAKANGIELRKADSRVWFGTGVGVMKVVLNRLKTVKSSLKGRSNPNCRGRSSASLVDGSNES